MHRAANQMWVSVAVIVLGLIVISAAIALAADEKDATSRTYQVDTDASRVFVRVGSATPLGHEHGVEARLKSGVLTLGGDGALIFDMGSFTADTPEARKRVGLGSKKFSASDARKVTEEMRSADVLDVAHFPTATFQITAAKAIAGQAADKPPRYQLKGKFTLHGIERPIQLEAQLEAADVQAQVRLTGSFTIKQSDYGIKPYSTLGGLVKVADELGITGDLILVAAER